MVTNIASQNNMNHSSVKPDTIIVNNITSHNNMNHSSVKHQTVMVNNIPSYNNMSHTSVKPQRVMVNNITSLVVARYIIYHYSLVFERGVVHIVVAVLLLPITISDFTEVWFMLLWLAILLTITV
jgi:hypothetical protein